MTWLSGPRHVHTPLPRSRDTVQPPLVTIAWCAEHSGTVSLSAVSPPAT